MILYEYEGKEILAKSNIAVPKSELILTPNQDIVMSTPLYVKAQVLSGKRKISGGIILVDKESDLKEIIKQIFSKTINNEVVSKVLLEEVVKYDKKYYLSISYSGDTRSPIITFSESGGTGIEDRKSTIFTIDILTKKFQKEGLPESIVQILPNLINIFLDNDMLLLEINPLVEVDKSKLIALDAKVKLDDSTTNRHQDWNFEARSVAGHKPTKNEIEAKLIDQNDYRGTAGSTYFDLDGDIAVLASGGGASLTAMDALIKSGGKPSNYTEYSGNPPKEKVEKLTEIVLDKKNINGLWVVGAIANFTDIYETLSGFLEALRKVSPKPKFPILIRRGGPNDKKAFDMLREVKDFDLNLYGQEISITKSAEIMTNLAKKYATTTK